MRVLMITDSFYPEIGGSEMAIWRLGEALVRLGHTVGVAVISKPKASNPSSLLSFWNVSSRVGGMDIKFFGKVHNLRKIMREWKPDIVNVHFMLESGYVGVKAAHAEHIPCVLTNRGKGLYNVATNLQERALYAIWNRGSLGADAFLATSDEMVEMLKVRYDKDSQALSNGVDTNAFTPDKDGTQIREQYGVAAGQRVILCARRLVPKNGIEYIVRALPEIRKHHDAVLWLAAPLNREYESLKALAEKLGLSSVVRFLGTTDHTQLPLVFRAADVVVQPSIAEARSLACLEAMACGCAIVATAAGGLKELIMDGENGVLIEPFQDGTSYEVVAIQQDGVDRLATAVVRVLSDEVLRERIQKGARAMALTCSWEEIARQTLVVYERTQKNFHADRCVA